MLGLLCSGLRFGTGLLLRLRIELVAVLDLRPAQREELVEARLRMHSRIRGTGTKSSRGANWRALQQKADRMEIARQRESTASLALRISVSPSQKHCHAESVSGMNN